MMVSSRWPKTPIQLTLEEEALKEQVLLECQDCGYTGMLGWVQNRGHQVAEALSQTRDHKVSRSLDLGCGSGYHFNFTKGDAHIGIDLSMPHLQRARQRFPAFGFAFGDVYFLPFKSATFDRVISIYVLEHLGRLPESLAEVRRILKPGGEFLVGLPAEGGLAYDWGRRFTTKRHFEQKYQVDYLRLVRSEHCNTAQEVIAELEHWFEIDVIRYLPFFIPTMHLNAIVVLRCVQKNR